MRREPRSLYTVVAVTGILATLTNVLTNISNVIQSFNSVVSKLPIPDKLKEFLKLYSEKLFEKVDEQKLEALEKAPLITKKEAVALGINLSVVTFVLSFVETNGFPNFVNFSTLMTVVPSVIFSTIVVLLTDQFSEFVCTRVFKVYRQLRLWVYGFAAFLISGLVFLTPFSSPVTMKYQSGEISNKTKALMVLSKMFALLALALPFSILYSIGFYHLGDSGLLLTFMVVFYSLLPLSPLPGKAVFDYREDLSLTLFVLAGLLFYFHITNLLPYMTYFWVGGASFFFFAITLNESLRKTMVVYLKLIRSTIFVRQEVKQ
jgi:hypothetical protein